MNRNLKIPVHPKITLMAMKHLRRGELRMQTCLLQGACWGNATAEDSTLWPIMRPFHQDFLCMECHRWKDFREKFVSVLFTTDTEGLGRCDRANLSKDPRLSCPALQFMVKSTVPLISDPGTSKPCLLPAMKSFLSFFFLPPTNYKPWWGCIEKGPLIHCWWECKLVQPL